MNETNINFEGKSIKEIVDYADNLFRGDDNKKIEAHKIYKLVLEKIPNLQDGEKPYAVRGIIRKRIWDCLRKLGQNLDYFSEAGQDMLVKDNFFKNFQQISKMMMNNDNPQFYKSFGGQVIQNHQRNASHNTNNNIHMPLVAGQNIN